MSYDTQMGQLLPIVNKGEEAFTKSWAKGRALTINQAIELTLHEVL